MASAAYSPNSTYTFSVRSRMDEQTWNVQRFEAEGRANFNRWSISMMYGNYASQPELGYLTRREGILTTGSIKLATNWVVTGSARWDLEANKINQYVLGAGYVESPTVYLTLDGAVTWRPVQLSSTSMPHGTGFLTTVAAAPGGVQRRLLKDSA